MSPILNGYGVMGIFNSRTRPHVNRAYGTSWRLVAYCMHCKHYLALLLPADSPIQLQTVQFPYLDTWGISGRWGGYSPGYKLIVMLRQGTVVIV